MGGKRFLEVPYSKRHKFLHFDEKYMSFTIKELFSGVGTALFLIGSAVLFVEVDILSKKNGNG